MISEYWKSILNQKNRVLYDKMVIAFKKHIQKIECGYEDTNDILRTYEAVFYDHPEFFYLSVRPRIEQRISILGKGEKTLFVDYIFSPQEIEKYECQLNDIFNSLSKIMDSCNELDKEKILCDYIVEKTAYAIDNKFNQNAATVLLKHEGQCTGIAMAMKLLLDFFDIESLLIVGKAKVNDLNNAGPHAWNIVKVGGKYYHLDVTFLIAWNRNKEKPFIYLYYNCSDEQIERDHSWKRELFPPCYNQWMIIISSLYELRGLLKGTDLTTKSIITFVCKIPCSDKKVLLKHILSLVSKTVETEGKRKKIVINEVGLIIMIMIDDE